jgi:hypothetical protein
MRIELPSWQEISSQVERCVPLDPIEQFIYNHTPGGSIDESDFRSELEAALSFYVAAPQDKGSAGLHPTTGQVTPCTCKRYGNFRQCPVCGGSIFYQTV